MTEDLDKQIREATRNLYAAELPTAVIYPWNVLSHDLTEWPGLFGTTRFGIVIKRSSVSAEWKNAKRDRLQLDYDHWFFYKFRSGKIGDNSDDEFAEVLTKAHNCLKAEPRLGFDDEVEMHDLLQFRRITTINCGEETLHFAEGRLTVHLCC